MVRHNGEALRPLELWGGIECTVNRVGDQFHDQVQRTGHAGRLDDLDLIATLGVRRLRYPVLWERTAPRGLDGARWDWPDQRLARLRALRIEPIVGLVHHGSGPAETHLLDRAFAPGLAAFAGAVARRYPWVRWYTPVNEPLTTARFSALYGHWYPHAADALSLARALLNQCRAVVLAMRAIRRVNPEARLVQTDDAGRTFSTSHLAYQAEFENHRRWLAFDLLCGRVDRAHPLWSYLRGIGVTADELRWFIDNSCPPDVIGLNWYVTSDRFLDERLERYPHETHGGNEQERYADVAAVRVTGLRTFEQVLCEAWRRYRRPVAITEAQLQAPDALDRLRWFWEAWDGAMRARRQGADVRAVTAWALLGAYDWDSLVTRWRGRYEPGAFDVSRGAPRPTALAELLRTLAQGRRPGPAVTGMPGWWRREARLLYARAVELTG
ncbi:MAG: family 1 glycosylhydrolase [Phycisphaeraceae bacterium]